MRIDSAFPSNYLKAADLAGRNVSVIMDKVTMEDIGGDHKPVLYFQGKEKGLVLNKTNSTNISTAYGVETDEWTGKEIVLFPAWVDFQGRSVEAIRVRRPAIKDRAMQSHQAPSSSPAPRASRDDQLDDDIPF